jgi:hypothetical protein
MCAQPGPDVHPLGARGAFHASRERGEPATTKVEPAAVRAGFWVQRWLLWTRVSGSLGSLVSYCLHECFTLRLEQ